MNKMQRLIAFCGGLLVCLIVLLPPWVETVEKVNRQTGERSIHTANLQGRVPIFAAPQKPEPDFDIADGSISIVDVHRSYGINWQVFTLQIIFVSLVTAISCFAAILKDKVHRDNTPSI
jgi:hypothetical protein